MHNLRNPKWLFIINTLPIAVLFFLFISQFNIIKTLLDPESIELWKIFGVTLGSLTLLNFLYAIFLVIKKKKVSAIYAVLALLIYIPFIYVYGVHADRIIPFSIPTWMIPGEMIFYVGTFLMPTLAYALFLLVAYLTPDTKAHKPWKSFLFAIGVPIVWYIFLQVILPLWKPVDWEFQIHASIIFVIAGTLLFLFFLIRAVYIIVAKKADVWKKYQLAWKIPIALILPIIGLLVNNGALYSEFGEGIFGNFSNHWFYILAVLNGLFICLPSLNHFIYRLFLFVGRSVTFAFTLYFFIVFLPFLPISILAIMAIGTGFLLLAPLILFLLHINELSKDFKYLEQIISKRILSLISGGGFLVLPIIISIVFIGHKNTLEETLDYLYTPDYAESYEINEGSLEKTLDAIKMQKNRSGATLFGNQIPYISTYFNWLVLDNLTLSDAKIQRMEAVFLGENTFNPRHENIRNQNVEITDSNVKSVYDEKQKVWRTWIDLEITNSNEDAWAPEYATKFDLPVGCWISDYYLYVGDRKEMGILSEKKSAMWIFSQIRNEKRDPGILYYLTGNKVAFRVFPFAKDEVRKTGIEFIHKEAVTISIDKIDFQLGESNKEMPGIIENDKLVYIPAKEKTSLDSIQRQAYFHFLLDVSEENKLKKDEFIARINHLVTEFPDLSKSSRISKVNSYVSTFELSGEWENYIRNEDFKGGFFLDRAIRATLVNSYYQNDKSYPVMIVVTDSISNAILDKDFSDLSMTFPENKLFYHLSLDGELVAHSLEENPQKPLEDSSNIDFHRPCLEYKTSNNESVYFSPDTLPGIALKTDFVSIAEDDIREKDWLSALQMQGNWMSQNLDPSKSDNEWLKLVRSSFESRIMTPVTAYIVVENEAQKAILKKKQKQILSGNKSFDAGEDAQQMSEPGMIVMLVLLISMLLLRERRKRNKEKSLG
jgi:hypothetical protein